ncbi:MAG: hypothetical protein S4CHLAM102_01980 [Chlamydiia bacterium]|nr:hypothetical protein [Chlamydiia bacterium]
MSVEAFITGAEATRLAVIESTCQPQSPHHKTILVVDEVASGASSPLAGRLTPLSDASTRGLHSPTGSVSSAEIDSDQLPVTNYKSLEECTPPPGWVEKIVFQVAEWFNSELLYNMGQSIKNAREKVGIDNYQQHVMSGVPQVKIKHIEMAINEFMGVAADFQVIESHVKQLASEQDAQEIRYLKEDLDDAKVKQHQKLKSVSSPHKLIAYLQREDLIQHLAPRNATVIGFLVDWNYFSGSRQSEGIELIGSCLRELNDFDRVGSERATEQASDRENHYAMHAESLIKLWEAGLRPEAGGEFDKDAVEQFLAVQDLAAKLRPDQLEALQAINESLQTS